MMRRSTRRRGAWLALLVLVSSLLAPFGARAHAAPQAAADRFGPVCASPGPGEAFPEGSRGPGTEVPPAPAGAHAGPFCCAACPCAPSVLPGPATEAFRSGTRPAFAGVRAFAAPAGAGQPSSPPLPARGPPTA